MSEKQDFGRSDFQKLTFQDIKRIKITSKNSKTVKKARVKREFANFSNQYFRNRNKLEIDLNKRLKRNIKKDQKLGSSKLRNKKNDQKIYLSKSRNKKNDRKMYSSKSRNKKMIKKCIQINRETKTNTTKK